MAGWSTAVFLAMMLSSGHGQSLVDVLFGSPQQSPGAGLSSSSSSASSSSSGGTGSSADGLALFAGALGSSSGGVGLSAGGLGSSAGGLGSSSGGLGSSAGGLGSSAGGLGLSAGGLGSSAGGLGSSAGGLGLFNSRGLSGFGSASQLTAQPQGFCTRKEKGILFRKCAMRFGMSHLMYFNYLAMRPICDARVFKCRKVEEMINCVNSQPVTQIGNECWPAVKRTITGFLNNYQLPCSYEQLKARCNHSVDLIPVDMRKKTGQGINGFPLRQFLMYYSMMSVMQGGAGLFPMA